MMNKLFTLILAGACFTVFAQTDIDYPYNPDFENDGFVGIEDVLELLSVYGTPFTPEQLLLDGASLTEIIESLQSQIDSLASYTNEGFGAIALNDSLLTEYLVGVAAASEEGDSTLGAWVMQLSEVVEQQQAQLDSIQSGIPFLGQGGWHLKDPTITPRRPQGIVNGAFVEVRLAELENYVVPQGFNFYTMEVAGGVGNGNPELQEDYNHGWYVKAGGMTSFLTSSFGNFAFGQTDTLFQVGRDTLSVIGHLVPVSNHLDFVIHNFKEVISFTVPDGKKLLLSKCINSHSLNSSFVVIDHLGEVYRDGVVHELLSNHCVLNAGTTISLTQEGQEYGEGSYFTLTGVLCSENATGSTLYQEEELTSEEVEFVAGQSYYLNGESREITISLPEDLERGPFWIVQGFRGGDWDSEIGLTLEEVHEVIASFEDPKRIRLEMHGEESWQIFHLDSLASSELNVSFSRIPDYRELVQEFLEVADAYPFIDIEAEQGPRVKFYDDGRIIGIHESPSIRMHHSESCDCWTDNDGSYHNLGNGVHRFKRLRDSRWVPD